MLSPKKVIPIACVVAIFLLASLALSGCTAKRRFDVVYLSISHDGAKLASITEFDFDADADAHGSDIQIWDMDTGELIVSQFPASVRFFEKDICILSPHGKYIAIDSSIYNTSSHAIVMNFSNELQDWSIDERLFIIKNSSNSIEMWSGVNFTKIKTISINETIISYHKMKFSPSGDELAFLPADKKSVYLINLTSDNVSSLENTSVNFSNEYTNLPHKISWSQGGGKIGLVYRQKNSDSYYIFIWDRKSGSLLNELHLNITGIPILSYDFERYGYVNWPGYMGHDNNVFEIYNLSTENKILELSTGRVVRPSYDWSHDGSIIVTGNDQGIIKIWNASTGELINSLETPIHTISVPGFELILAFCAIALILFWKRRR